MSRRKQYTERGISRVPCCRCGQPSAQQWNICADGNVFRGICNACDVALNKLVMAFMKVPNRAKKIIRYEEKFYCKEPCCHGH